MTNPAKKPVYFDFLANAATVIYTYAGNKTGYAQISLATFCNTTAAAVTFSLAIVSAAGTITDAKWRVLDETPLEVDQAFWWFEDAGVAGNLVLKDGERLVAWASSANAVAARIVITEMNAG